MCFHLVIVWILPAVRLFVEYIHAVWWYFDDNVRISILSAIYKIIYDEQITTYALKNYMKESIILENTITQITKQVISFC